MNTLKFKSNLFLLAAAAIWGFAFVAMRVSMKYMGPYTFTGVRFALGSLTLTPLILLSGRKPRENTDASYSPASTLLAGMVTGCVLFIGTGLQQTGIIDTSAGKAAFITGLYIVLVPLLGIFLKQRINMSTFLGIAVAVIGLYFLCITESFSVAASDLLVLAATFFWAVHILLIDHFSKKVDVLKFSCIQFATCSALSLITALFFEKITLDGLMQGIIPILYGGVCSAGIAFTFQVIGQKHAKPSHAAIILSMESVFACLGGLIILNENLALREYLGCALMLAGMLLSQLQPFKKQIIESTQSVQ